MKKLNKELPKSFDVPFIYTYPTTRMYKPIFEIKRDELFLENDINIYIHIPFCEQQCIFCGYLTAIESKDSERQRYVEALVKEIKFLALRNKRVKSINFGGGTPSLLSYNQLEKIMKTITDIFPSLYNDCNEISIEATPESISKNFLDEIKSLGFNRVSLGIQTLDNFDIKKAGRHNFSDSSLDAMRLVNESELFLCVDLMYGLPSQLPQSFQDSLEKIVQDYLPGAIELYRTVTIPGTVLDRKKSKVLWTPSAKFNVYEKAKSFLEKNGYYSESHVRFTLHGYKGYQQQSNIYEGQNLIGFGVGARSYTQNCHFRNINKGLKPVSRYIENIENNISVIESGIYLSSEEKARREIIYNLENFSIKEIQKKYKENIFMSSEVLGFLQRKDFEEYTLPGENQYYRDYIALQFFSDANKKQEKEYYGN